MKIFYTPEFYLLILFIFVQYEFFWKAFFLEKLHGDINKIQGDIFDYWVEMKLDFSDPIYLAVSKFSNGILSCSKEMDFLHIIATQIFQPKEIKASRESGRKDFENMVKKIKNKEIKNYIEFSLMKIRIATIVFSACSSPLIVISLIGLFLFLLGKEITKNALGFLQNPNSLKLVYLKPKTILGKASLAWEKELKIVNSSLVAQINRNENLDLKAA